ncbi:MAG TPA: ATP-binding protein [Candidatus Saccharimonadales bacterium]|nr:ATP-binding protein [Candidatus Saccharimonadales bacterium]
MPDLYLTLDIVVVVALSVLAITVLIKNTSVLLNRIFAYFVGSIAVWIIANYISNDLTKSPQTALLANYFVFPFSYAASLFLLSFGIELADDHKFKRLYKNVKIPLFLIALLGATPLVVTGVHVQGQLYAVEFGPLAPLYFITLLLNVVAVIYVVYRNFKASHGIQRERLGVLFKSLCWTFPILLLAQAVLPATTGWFGLTNVGIMPMLILVYGLYYSVVKHKLFDLRLIIIRSVVYVLTLGVISVFYALASHNLLTLVSKSAGQLMQDVLNAALIIVIVLAYAPLKHVFNKLTNRFFYQDAYDPQQFFNDFNQSLVAEVELNGLLSSSSSLIGGTLKSHYCLIALIDGGSLEPRIVGTVDKKFSRPTVKRGLELVEKFDGPLIVMDDLTKEHERLKELMLENDVAVLARLRTSADHHLGYIVLGPKKSGNPYTRQDLRVIETVANELVLAIQNALRFEEIEQFNATLQERINLATKKLRHSNDKLRTLDQTKDDFISMASHQLRTPLTSVKGYVSMVLDGDAGKITPLQRKLLTQSFISSQRMVYLISDLLNVSRLRTGKFVIEPVPSNIATIISDEVQQLVETAKGRNLELVYNKPESFPTYMLDETKLRQVIMNFIDNAIYYTPSGGRIEINLVEHQRSIEFTVVDNGIGVSKVEQHHLFSKFFRANNAKRARPDGTGLGLFMAKKVVIAQGGAIIFKSQEGKGSTFGFTFAKEHLQLAPEK